MLTPWPFAPGWMGPWPVALLLSLLWAVGLSPDARAHFTHFEPRILHVSPQQGGIQVLLRMPLPLLLLDRDWKGGDSGQPVRFTRREQLGGQWRYAISAGAIEQGFAEFERRVLAGIALGHKGQPVKGLTLTHVHIFNSDQRKPFSTLASAEAAFQGGRVVVEAGAVDLFDSGVDLRLFVPDRGLTGSFTLDSELGTHLKAIERLANIVQVHAREGKSDTFSSVGALHSRFATESGAIDAFVGQIKNGVVHILMGLDHLLFVLLIALASDHWLQTLKRATAFTAGHSITLALGLAGYLPEGPWFIPLVETLIALTILYAGVAVILQRRGAFGLTAIVFVGLIHGYGFSFVLDELVTEAGGLTLSSLIGFNLGIEFGQLAIYAVAFPLLLVYARIEVLQRWKLPALLSAAAVLVSAVWVYERGIFLMAELLYL